MPRTPSSALTSYGMEPDDGAGDLLPSRAEVRLKLRQLLQSGRYTRAGLARALGIHHMSLNRFMNNIGGPGGTDNGTYAAALRYFKVGTAAVEPDSTAEPRDAAAPTKPIAERTLPAKGRDNDAADTVALASAPRAKRPRPLPPADSKLQADLDLLQSAYPLNLDFTSPVGQALFTRAVPGGQALEDEPELAAKFSPLERLLLRVDLAALEGINEPTPLTFRKPASKLRPSSRKYRHAVESEYLAKLAASVNVQRLRTDVELVRGKLRRARIPHAHLLDRVNATLASPPASVVAASASASLRRASRLDDGGGREGESDSGGDAAAGGATATAQAPAPAETVIPSTPAPPPLHFDPETAQLVDDAGVVQPQSRPLIQPRVRLSLRDLRQRRLAAVMDAFLFPAIRLNRMVGLPRHLHGFRSSDEDTAGEDDLDDIDVVGFPDFPVGFDSADTSDSDGSA